MVISNFLIISLCISLFYCVGLLTFITEYEENKCELTYMFEYPQFTKIDMKAHYNYPQYGLYAYSEGKLTEKVRSMKFNGVPVLFIPGNAGSYKQVRSLASVALRKAFDLWMNIHFDFFTLDLNNEISGLNGAVLPYQTDFLNHSIHRVLELYESEARPKSVIVIGHSMGGVIAHGLMVNPLYVTNVDLLITLATPHRRPSVYFDSYAAEYYESIKNNKYDISVSNKTFVSIAGGNGDHLVNSYLTQSNFSSMNVVTTGIPKVWLTMDHACIMWCKQFVKVIVRSLFDCIDLKTKQLSDDHDFRLNIFKHHLMKNSGTSMQSLLRYQTIYNFNDWGDWREDLRRQYTISLPRGSKYLQFLMVRLINDPKHQHLFVQGFNLETDWIFACSASQIRGNNRICTDGIHLSHTSKISASLRFKRRTFDIDLFNLKKKYPDITHVVIQVIPSRKPISVNFDVHNRQDRLISIILPRWFSFSKTPIIKQTESETLYYEIELLGLQHVIQSYLLYVEPIKCSKDVHEAVADLHVPWAEHNVIGYFTELHKKPMQINLFSSRPYNNNSTAKIYLNLHPSCQYSISVRNSFMGMLVQFARFYSPFLIANIAAVILMTFRSQLNMLHETGKCSLFQSALSMSTKPYYLVTSVKLLSRVLSWSKLSVFTLLPDTQILVDENLDFLLLPLLLYVVSVGLTYMFSLILWATLILSETTVHRFLAKFLTRTIGGAIKWSDWLINALHRIPCVVALTLFSLGTVTCTQLSLALGVAYYFLKLTQMCQEYLESLMYFYLKKILFKIRRLFKNSSNTETNENATIINEVNEMEETNSNIEVNEMEETNLNIEVDDSGEQNKESVVEKLLITSNENKESSTEKNNENSSDDNLVLESSIGCSVRLRKKSKNIENDEIENKIALITEEPKDKKETNNNTVNSALHFHFTLFLMWLMVAVLNVPVVVTWAHNFPKITQNDVFIPGIVLCLCAIPLWQMEIPKLNKLYYKQLGFFVYMMTILCLIYTPINLQRLTNILTLTILIIVLHQLLAPTKHDSDDSNDEPDPVSLINDIKTKLE